MHPRYPTLRRLLSRVGIAPTLAAAVLACSVAAAIAASGDLDPTFGTGGIVTTTLRPFEGLDSAGAVTVLPDGRIAVAGNSCDPDSSDPTICSAFIAVYTLDGTLDPTFGAGGVANVPVPGVSAFAAGVAVQPGRGIVFGGTVITAVVGENRVLRAFVVARVGFDGAPDPTFGDGGTRTTVIGGDDQLSAIAVQPDGKIVAAGWASDATDDARETIDFAVVRYDANGTLDPVFGQGGVVTTDLGFGVDQVEALAIQPDGKIVVAGVAFLRFGGTFAVARYDTNGALDPTFAGTGKTTIANTQLERARTVVVEPGGRIVLAGAVYLGSFQFDFALARLDPNGTLDTSFGTGGLALTDLGGPREFAAAIVRQPDGKLLVAGEADGKFALVRYQATGALDASFGTGGVVLTTIPAGSYAGTGAQAAVLQADGALVAAGSTVIDSNSVAIALARYQGGVCGNGVTDADEACDDGNLADGDGCDTNCTATACGNGVRTGGEACDDGNTVDGDCCSAGCDVEAAGSPCAGDGNGCTDDVCDGTGFCGLANVAPCDDGSPCTGQDTCGGGACDGTLLCTACEGCNGAVGCVASPSGCFSTYTRSTLAFSRDRLRWRAGELTVREPRLTDDHTLCIFDESGPAPRVVFAATALGTDTCAPDRQSCWRVQTRKHGSFVYRSRVVTPDGVTGIRLLPDLENGQVTVKVEAPLPGLPLSFPLRVQLMTKHSCAEATYRATDVIRNDPTGFRAMLRPR